MRFTVFVAGTGLQKTHDWNMIPVNWWRGTIAVRAASTSHPESPGRDKGA